MAKKSNSIEEAVRTIKGPSNSRYHMSRSYFWILGHYGSIHRDIIYARELYNLEEKEIEFLKGLDFQLGDYPFMFYELDTESIFHVDGEKMEDIVFEQTDLDPSGLLLVVKGALGSFACVSKYHPKNSLPLIQIIEYGLDLLLSLLIDFKWSSWEQNYRRVSRKLALTGHKT